VWSRYLREVDRQGVGLVTGPAGAVPAGGVGAGSPFIALQSPAYIDGKYYPAGVWIRTAFINNATIDFAQITDTIQSNNWNWAYPGTGWRINKDGNAWFNNLNARGNITANSLDVNSANIVSTLMLQGNSVTVPDYWSGGVAQVYVPPEAVNQKIVVIGFFPSTLTTVRPSYPYWYTTFGLTYAPPGQGWFWAVQEVVPYTTFNDYFASGDDGTLWYSTPPVTIIWGVTANVSGWWQFHGSPAPKLITLLAKR
jgi:hypothetical protein